MKVGSLVVCINDDFLVNDITIHLPVKGILYIVRDIRAHLFSMYITLEEIVNEPRRYKDGYYEPAFNVKAFREVQPPMDLTELLEETKQQPQTI